MSRELERRLIKMEAKHKAERGGGKRIERMTDAELTAAIRACNAKLEEEHGPGWREWLAANDPEGHRTLSQLEQEGAL
ncbi:MAG: hypothetical protein J0I42_18100 [Bosea sp.]|uniref:hypothetical protein n=1 Tax=Bosea sp. (in: a-proteobacteria) TaxID=1871050 RepID=UPI001AC8F28B|nr:hypothetical protein [Bosea sp. (in: a-proteobacteria)]MBN9453855.1 hypothetical protein [Bosea sp. (in: a-proteobacteria)]